MFSFILMMERVLVFMRGIFGTMAIPAPEAINPFIILEAGRFTQTGGNMQDLSYIVVEEKLPELKAMAFKTLKSMGENIVG